MIDPSPDHGAPAEALASLSATEEKICPLCDEGVPYRVVTRRWGVRIVRCTGCGLVFANPQASQDTLKSYYSPEYFQQNAAKFLRLPMERDVELRLRGCLGELAAVRPAGRILDVGCGTGLFVWMCANAGYRAEGLELSPYASQLGREHLGIQIRTGRFEEVDELMPFEGITMWDFLEHTPDPVATLRRAHRLLVDGGHLLLTVPNVGSCLARCMGPRWVGFDKASEHLFYFTRSSLRRMLALAGFEVLEVRPYAWTCTADFLAVRGERTWPAGGRLLRGAFRRLKLQDSVVRIPSVNLLAVARKTSGRA